MPAGDIEPPVGVDRIRTVVNAAEDNQRKKLNESCPLTTAGANSPSPRGLVDENPPPPRLPTEEQFSGRTCATGTIPAFLFREFENNRAKFL